MFTNTWWETGYCHDVCCATNGACCGMCIII
jgi:hypothetical protein